MKIASCLLHTLDLQTRLPFRFGITTLTRVRHALLRVEVDFGGTRCCGISGDHLFPKWFKKDPDQSFEAEVEEQIHLLRRAVAFAADIEAPTLFAFWKMLYERQLAWAATAGVEPLLALFPVTLLERAMLDALARHEGKPVARLIVGNRLGIDFAAADPAYAPLAGTQPCDWLPAKPLEQVEARHTVGLTDPLSDAAIPAAERVADGLPQGLDACIAHYGLSHFKIKVCGNPDTDLPRLRQLAELIPRLAPADFLFSLDGNEQFKTCADFRAFWQTVAGDGALKPFFAHCLFIEQPINRKEALTDAMMEIQTWADLPPIIIDESDATLESTPRALHLGYAGTSHKNCKGVMRGILNRCLINSHRTRQPELAARYLMSGEDLVNIGPVALPQDLVIQAVLGNATVERNGHHYFAGLQAFPAAIQQAMLEAHPDLFIRSPSGWPTLAIKNGGIGLHSILNAPFAVGCDLPMEGLTPVDLV